jgi:hypothetical protein
VTGLGVPADIDLDDDAGSGLPNSETFNNLAPGPRTFTESVLVSGWALTMIACTGQVSSTITIGSDADFDAGDVGVTVDLAEGEDVTCTFTNTGPGSITIAKDAQPNSAQDFDFDVIGAGVPADIDLDDDADTGLASSETFTNLAAGSRTFTESAVGGWRLAMIACTGHSSSTVTIGSDADFDAGDRAVTVDLAQGENVTCTFTNVQQIGSITIVKDAQPDGPQDFDFDVTGLGVPADIDLDDDAGSGVPSSETFSSLSPGARTFTESVVSGWAVTMIACTGQVSSTVTIGSDSDFDPGDRAVTIDLAEGEDVTCTFTNTGPGSITIVKDAQPDGPQDFDFDVTGVGVPADIDLDDDADSGLASSETFTGLAAGTRTFSESAVAGWTLSMISCTGQDSSTVTIGSDADFDPGDVSVTIDLAQGEHVSCTFTNTQ